MTQPACLALLDINNMPAIEWVVRAARAIPQIDEVVIATSKEPSDDIIVEWCNDTGVKYFRGSKSDVLNRFYSAAKEFDADIIMRLTCDCPFFRSSNLLSITDSYAAK